MTLTMLGVADCIPPTPETHCARTEVAPMTQDELGEGKQSRTAGAQPCDF